MCGRALSVMLLTLAVVLLTPHDYSGTFEGGYSARFIASRRGAKKGSAPFKNSQERTLVTCLYNTQSLPLSHTHTQTHTHTSLSPTTHSVPVSSRTLLLGTILTAARLSSVFKELQQYGIAWHAHISNYSNLTSKKTLHGYQSDCTSATNKFLPFPSTSCRAALSATSRCCWLNTPDNEV